MTALLVCLFSAPFLMGAGCGGTCPPNTTRYEVKGSDFPNIEGAKDGAVCVSRDPKEIGFPLLGTYQYDDFGKLGAPIVRLDADGGSVFQRHGVTAQPIEWGVLMDMDGVPVGQQSSHGAKLFLFYKPLDAGTAECTPGLVCDPNSQQKYTTGVGEWDVAELSVSFDRQKLYIYGERVLDCASTCAVNSKMKLTQ